jgi:hypothetical protein
VASFLGSSVSDLDVGALRGIAIIGTTGSGGNWEYSLNGTTWVGVGSVSASGSLLLRSTDFIRFMPGTAVYNGTATITYRAWDQTGTTAGGQGTKVSTALSGGFQAFSSTTQTATAKSNLSPQLNLASPNLPSLTGPTPEPVGVTVAALAGANISDGDVGAVEGIAITATTGESGGTWQYKLSGSSTWVAVGSVAANSSLLLRAEDSIRFLPSAANWYGKATITYRAWDQTGTTAGGQGSKVSTTSNGNPHPFSSGTQVATVRSNIAPKLGLGFPMLPNVTSSTPAPAGTLVSTIVGATITDQDPGAVRGIAIGGTSETDGTWQFSLNGTTWTDIGAIPNGSFFLLRSTDFVRFLPNVTTFIGEASLTYRAWDQTGGTAGLQGTFVSATLTGDFTPYSSEIQTAKVRSNQAPVLAAGTPTLTAVTTLTPAGQTVASFIGSLITDSDAGAVEGIAITGLTTAGGTWQFSLNGGSTWTAVGTVSGDTALLLRSTDMIRFVPTAAGFTGQASITYRAWDQTGTTAGQQGTKVSTDIFGGFTAFSNALQTATVNITV